MGKLRIARGDKGFTLIELLVVISIIALLLAILMPSLNMVKKKGRAIVCMSNIKQWGVVYTMYAVQNKNRFQYEGATATSYWLKVWEDFYGDVDSLRICPEATKTRFGKDPEEEIGAVSPGLNYGNATALWGPNLTFAGYDIDDYASYGANLWVFDLPAGDGGWFGEPQLHIRKTDVSESSKIPVMFDCCTAGAGPMTGAESEGMINNIGWLAILSLPPPDKDVLYTEDGISGSTANNMYRVCMDRHSMGINVSFVDGSARRVKLRELWLLKWNKASRVNREINLPAWLN